MKWTFGLVSLTHLLTIPSILLCETSLHLASAWPPYLHLVSIWPLPGLLTSTWPLAAKVPGPGSGLWGEVAIHNLPHLPHFPRFHHLPHFHICPTFIEFLITRNSAPYRAGDNWLQVQVHQTLAPHFVSEVFTVDLTREES